MFRLVSFGCTVLLVWQIIGVGYHVAPSEVHIGALSDRIVSEREYRFASPVSAVLSANTHQHSYNSAIFVGDVLLARNVEFLMKTKGEGYPFEGLRLSDFGVMPAIVGNFEAAIPEIHVPTPIGQIDFSVPVDSIPALSKAGFTHVSLANNHALDFGSEALSYTQSILAKHLSPFGHPAESGATHVNLIEVEDYTVAIIGLNYFSHLDEREIQQTLQAVSSKSDYQIIYIHWGEEYALRHNSSQRKLAEQLVSFGADLIVGHHPHVVQGIDLIEGVPVFYSLGNYIFDQYFSKDVREGLVLSLSFTDKLIIDLIPVTSQNTISQPQLMTSEKHAHFLETLARKSTEDLRPDIIKGTIKIDWEIATSDKVAMMLDTDSYVQ